MVPPDPASLRHMASPFDPDKVEFDAIMTAATDFVRAFLAGLEDAPSSDFEQRRPVAELMAAPGEQPAPAGFDGLLEVFRDAAAQAVDTAGPGYLAYFPAGGLWVSAVADLLAATVNRYTGVSAVAPALVTLERGVLRWLCDEFALPEHADGLFTTGASPATLSALVAARQHVLGAPDRPGLIYVTEHTHHCVAKAARIAGLPADAIRTVPVTDQLRMDPAAAADLIAHDRAAHDRADGAKPFLLVGTAGTTSTGTIDPLPELAELARREGLWFHVDAAYGGGFQLTARGKRKLAGIERADSIAFDPHKTMFMHYGIGALLVRDPDTVRAAHGADAAYLQDLKSDTLPPDNADFGAELTRDYRGLRIWLPLHLYGVGAFRAALDEKLDLADLVHRELAAIPGVRVLVEPDLTVLAFRVDGDDGDDERNMRLLRDINASRRVFLSSTRIDGTYWLRLCVLSHRTHRDRITEAIDIIRAAATSEEPVTD